MRTGFALANSVSTWVRSPSDDGTPESQRTILVQSAFMRCLCPNATRACALSAARRACRPHVIHGRSELRNAASRSRGLCHGSVYVRMRLSPQQHTLTMSIVVLGCVLLRRKHKVRNPFTRLFDAQRKKHFLGLIHTDSPAVRVPVDASDVPAYTRASSACGA